LALGKKQINIKKGKAEKAGSTSQCLIFLGGLQMFFVSFSALPIAFLFSKHRKPKS
jgi:hypothetical protein